MEPWWILWLLLFGVLEARALIQKSYPDTLTASLRKWFALEGKPKFYPKLRRIALLLLLAWLGFHLLSRPGMF
jgi:hypothetical protein